MRTESKLTATLSHRLRNLGVKSKLDFQRRCSCLPWHCILFWKRGGEGYERQHMMSEIEDI
jgi:hypothetical protein